MPRKTKARVKPPQPSRIWVAVEEPFQFKNSVGKLVTFDEGTCFEVKSVATDGQFGLILEPTEAKKKGFKFRVRPNDVRVYMGRIPDYRLDMWFVEFGYQADHFKRCENEELPVLQGTGGTCRDFGGSYELPWLVERFQRYAEQMILKFKQKL